MKQVTPLDHAYAELTTIRRQAGAIQRQVEALQRTLASLINEQQATPDRKTPSTLTDPRTGKAFTARRAVKRRR